MTDGRGGAALAASAKIIRARRTLQQSTAGANRYVRVQTDCGGMEYS